MKKALGIARVSTERQSANDRVSHAEQSEKIRSWCMANGYDCIDVLYETVSRNKELDPDDHDSRPVFWGGWDRLKSGEVDALVFWVPDRFCAGQAGADFVYWLAQSRKYGDGIRFTEGEPPRDGKFATIMNAVAGSQAHESWDRLIEIMKAGREGHAKRGEFAGGALPFWIKWVKPVKHDDGSVERGYFELKAEESALMNRIIDLFEGGLGSEKIANILTDERVPTPSSRSPQWREHSKKRRENVWDGATILSCLHNRVLCGEYLFGGRPRGKLDTRAQEPVIIEVKDRDGKSLALITPEHFDAIQERLASNKRSGTARQSSGWPLQGLIWSEACGYTYSARTDGRTGRRVYRCPGRQARRHREDGNTCNCPPLPADALERAVVAATRRLLQDPEARRKAVGDYVASLESRKAVLAGQLGPVDSDLARIQKQIDDLSVAVSMDRLSRGRYDDEVAALEDERRRISTRRDRFTSAQRELQEVEASLADINVAIADGLLHISVWPHGKKGQRKLGAIVWKDDESDDPIIQQESFADLARRLRLKVVVRSDGRIEITGLLQPLAVSIPNGPRTASAPAGSGRRRME